MALITKAKSPPKFFKSKPLPGEPLCASGIINGIHAMAKALENLEIEGGRLEWKNGILRIIIE